MTVVRLSEQELKKKIQEMHYGPSKKFIIHAVIPVIFEKVWNKYQYQAKYFDFYYTFIPK